MLRSRRARSGATILRTRTRWPGSPCIGESWRRLRSWTRGSSRCSRNRTAPSNSKRSKTRALSWARPSSIPTTSCSAITPFIRASLRSTEAKEKSRRSASASARRVASSHGKTQNPARVRRPMIQNTQIVYAKPPADGALPDPAGTFNVVHTPFDTEAVNLKAGEVLVENHYLSIDPYHRFGLYDPALARSQFPATKPGTIISTYGVSRVLRSANPKYVMGDLLYSWVRWERFTVVDEPNLQYLQKVKAGIDPVHYLGPLGAPGLTGYAGITRIAKPKRGETIVVSATTGAVGMVASQLAKRLGLTVVGMAGSDEKVRYLVDELGLDAAFNYRTVPSLEDALKKHCPQGIDIFFDLVGEMREEFEAPLSDGRMKFKTYVAEGLENLPAAFYGMFTGESFGKTVVKV